MANVGIVSRALLASTIATGATTVASLILSKKETGRPAAALNATSHIVWGDAAAKHDAPDVAHTVLGGALNAGAVALWSSIHAVLPRPRGFWGRARNASFIAALAYVTDYHLVPKRLTPGFEKRLRLGSLLGMYAVLAASLHAADALSVRR